MIGWDVSEGFGAVAERLVVLGADVNLADSDGWTPLHYAACGGYLECVQLHLTGGADVLLADRQGRTALTLAEQKTYESVASLLRSTVALTSPR